ncbi:MAG: hypothetical protein HY813_02890 [Candidatus Portnoybacteria bacterium]|nr:hypothetical protein [Candidatus Portnoybacteria bacterium]
MPEAKSERERLIKEVCDAKIVVVYPPVIGGPYSRILLWPISDNRLTDFLRGLNLNHKIVLKVMLELCYGRDVAAEYDKKSFQFLADTLGKSLIVLSRGESGFKKKYLIFHSQESLFGRPIIWLKSLFWKNISRDLR